MEINFNQDWRFFRGHQAAGWEIFFDDSNWEIVCLPHTIRLEEADCCGGKNYLGEGWYRKHFTIDSETKEKKLFLEFNGAKHLAYIYLNGSLIHTNTAGYLPFVIDITDKVLAGEENIIAVMVDNSDNMDILPGQPQGGLDFCYFGGLYRNVVLQEVDPLHITNPLYENETASGGVFITSENVSKKGADLRIKVHVRNDYRENKTLELRTVTTDLDGSIIKESISDRIELKAGSSISIEQYIHIDNPKLWHPNSPNLYTVVNQILCNDTAVDEVSQTIGIRKVEWKEEGFFLNGELLQIWGANRHQEYVHIGDAMPDVLQEREAKKLREAGFQCIRTGHYPQSEAFMNACDKFGLMCIVPAPGWQFYRDNQIFKERAYLNIRSMVRWHRNHPSVILWEPILNETWYTEEFAKTAYKITHEEYPYEGCYAACDFMHPADYVYDVVYSHEPVEGKPVITREYGDNWLEQYGPCDSNVRCHRGEKGFYGGGEQGMLLSSLERAEHMNKKMRQTNYAGGCLWTAIDTNRGYIDNIAACGILDLYRLPKYAYYFYKAQGSLDAQIEGLKFGHFVLIANQWKEGPFRDVVVFGNCPSVKLYLNGNEIEERKPDDKYESLVAPPVTFPDVTWERGELKAVGFVDGIAVCESVVQTPELAVKLTLELADEGISLIADGSDIVSITVNALDKNGTVDPYCYQEISVEVTGAGNIIGQGTKGIRAWLEAGQTAILVQSKKDAGIIYVTVKSEGLAFGQTVLESVKHNKRFISGPLQVGEDKIFEYEADKKDMYSLPRGKKWDGFHNAALHCPATASSCQEGYGAEAVTNGNNSVKWRAANAESPQWVLIDLEKKRDIKGIKILWESDNTVYDYALLVSANGSDFKEIARNQATGQEQKVDSCEERDVQYVKVQIDNVSKGVPAICYVNVLKKNFDG